MKTIKKHLLIAIALILSFSASAQYHRQSSDLYFPDIKGYQTLKCDFHIHTIFSDGQVWPDYRVTEAIMDGIDVIAITDHIEYIPHENELKGDFNTAYEIAKKEGDKYGVMVIRGAEITRSMPPGHLNAIFIKDANKLDVEDVEDAIAEAYNQGAFIFWNHPCWKAQQPDTVKWFEIHTRLYDKGYIHGIEVVNFGQFCPEAWNWAIEKDLTIMSNSDIHSTTCMSKFEKHRPVTLVFAKEFSHNSVRNALDNKRTLLYYNETLYGNKDFLSQLLQNSLIIKKRYDKDQNIVIFDITNISSAPVILYRHKDLPPRSVPGKLEIPAKSNIHFHVDLDRVDSKTIWFGVGNYIYDIDKNLEFELKLK
ncbi:MAG: PHP domain-containing protein [Bacteroidales bacterium]|nr:PHP domain-containing protein [Bacteroidales bacterium]MDD4218255.1 PHP domain-containing protein [Bacteroidales bacterium]